jgi:hypothetical protein
MYIQTTSEARKQTTYLYLMPGEECVELYVLYLHTILYPPFA